VIIAFRKVVTPAPAASPRDRAHTESLLRFLADVPNVTVPSAGDVGDFAATVTFVLLLSTVGQPTSGST